MKLTDTLSSGEVQQIVKDYARSAPVLMSMPIGSVVYWIENHPTMKRPWLIRRGEWSEKGGLSAGGIGSYEELPEAAKALGLLASVKLIEQQS
ncbi:MAG TPA: hypothetical protein V6D07_18720 [Trichocoleus sp.]